MGKKKIKKVTIMSKGSPYFESSKFKVIDKGPKHPTLIKSSHRIVGIALLLPLIASAIWLIKLVAQALTPVPPGVQAAPISHTKLFALTAFMIGYSIFYILFYYSKKNKQLKQSV